MSRRVILLCLCISAILGCATPPSPVEETPSPDDSASSVPPETESNIITDSQTQIVIASPESLTSVISELGNSDAGGSELGRELIFIAQKILQIVYPLIEPPAVKVLPPPTNSIYPRLFEDVESGQYPGITVDEASFVALLIPPLALLESDAPDVTEASVSALNRILALIPGSVLAHFLLGLTEERSGNLDGAYERYSDAARGAESCYPAYIGMARVGLARKDYQTAREILETLSGNLPADRQILGLQARATFLGGDPEGADPLVADALQLVSTDLDLLLLRALILEALGKDEMAGRLLTRVETGMSDNIDVLLLKAKLLEKEERYEEALAVFQKGAELYPEDIGFARELGRLLIKTGRGDEGRAQLNSTLEKEPDQVDSLEILLIDAMTKQDWPAASGYVQRILEIVNDVKYLHSDVIVNMNMGDYERAVVSADELYLQDPENATYALLLSRALIGAGDIERAGDILSQALENESEGLVASDLFYYRSLTAQTREARLDDLRESIYQNGQNVVALIAISDLFESLENISNARRYLKQAVTLRPDDEELKEKLAQLEQKLEEN